MTVSLMLGQAFMKMSLATEAALAKKNEDFEFQFYEDRFVRLTDTELVIKNYYACFFGEKSVEVRNIKAVFFAPQETSCFPPWGLSLYPSFAWFAFQGCRSCSGSEKVHNVNIEVGEDSTKGFSCEDIYEFIKVLRPLVSEDTVFADEIK